MSKRKGITHAEAEQVTNQLKGEPNPEACKACGGTGKNSKGGPCLACEKARRAAAKAKATKDAAELDKVMTTEGIPPPPAAYQAGDILQSPKFPNGKPLVVKEARPDRTYVLADENCVIFAKPEYDHDWLVKNGYSVIEHVDVATLTFKANPLTKGTTPRKATKESAPSAATPDPKINTDGWKVVVEGDDVLPVGQNVRVRVACGASMTDRAFVCITPASTPHTMAGCNDGYLWYNFLTTAILPRGKEARALVREAVLEIPHPLPIGKYSVRLCTSDQTGGAEAAAVDFTVTK